MQYVQVPLAGAVHKASPARRVLIMGLARWALVAVLTFAAYCAVVVHEARDRPTSGYQDADAHKPPLFTSPPNRRSMLPATPASVSDDQAGGND